ncbi:hypothetical protein ACTG18_00250 [Aeromonas hydrophila]|uniref:hypothetical protein n=1 Tax=Aeromonas hydrophila TaxID=644 RepID=UPI003F78B2D9
MAWTIDDSQPRILYNKDKHVAVTASAMSKYHEWRREIVRGTDPKNAADKVGDMHYEQLSGKNKGITRSASARSTGSLLPSTAPCSR